ncbi:MAG: hypothetical protein COA66_10465 [Arcobacter sp.]|nr:MAG: hypothetical protein COA66_10465 [Arcobacter sp.]
MYNTERTRQKHEEFFLTLLHSSFIALLIGSTVILFITANFLKNQYLAFLFIGLILVVIINLISTIKIESKNDVKKKNYLLMICLLIAAILTKATFFSILFIGLAIVAVAIKALKGNLK